MIPTFVNMESQYQLLFDISMNEIETLFLKYITNFNDNEYSLHVSSLKWKLQDIFRIFIPHK